MGSDARKGYNEDWFRRINERLEANADVPSWSDRPFDVVCECSRVECSERIPITIPAYEDVRRDPRSFIQVPGHADPSCERILARDKLYDVVEKFGMAGEVAAREDPRSAAR